MVKKILLFTLLISASVGGLFWFNNLSNDYSWNIENSKAIVLDVLKEKSLPPMNPPENVKALYITAPAATNAIRMNYLINLAKSSDINSFVINVKDNNKTNLEQWMTDLVRQLREEEIYPIARIVVFQDNYTAQTRPDLVLKKSDGNIFGKTGYRWLDPASKEVWDINIEVAKKALELGFMEINFDYFRFPDGDVNNIVYPVYDYTKAKQTIINSAAAYMNKEIKKEFPEAVISLDIFADTFLRSVDIGIGQKLTGLAPYFDVISPMIYPSHYNAGNFNFENPAEHPYEVVYQTLLAGKKQLETAGINAKIRPWIQDFDMGAIYDREKIRGQIRAVEDSMKSCQTVLPSKDSTASPSLREATLNLFQGSDVAISSTTASPSLREATAKGSDVAISSSPSLREATRGSDVAISSTTASPSLREATRGSDVAISSSSIPCQQGWMSWNPSVFYARNKYSN